MRRKKQCGGPWSARSTSSRNHLSTCWTENALESLCRMEFHDVFPSRNKKTARRECEPQSLSLQFNFKFDWKYIVKLVRCKEKRVKKIFHGKFSPKFNSLKLENCFRVRQFSAIPRRRIISARLSYHIEYSRTTWQAWLKAHLGNYVAEWQCVGVKREKWKIRERVGNWEICVFITEDRVIVCWSTTAIHFPKICVSFWAALLFPSTFLTCHPNFCRRL